MQRQRDARAAAHRKVASGSSLTRAWIGPISALTSTVDTTTTMPMISTSSRMPAPARILNAVRMGYSTAGRQVRGFVPPRSGWSPVGPVRRSSPRLRTDAPAALRRLGLHRVFVRIAQRFRPSAPPPAGCHIRTDLSWGHETALRLGLRFCAIVAVPAIGQVFSTYLTLPGKGLSAAPVAFVKNYVHLLLFFRRRSGAR